MCTFGWIAQICSSDSVMSQKRFRILYFHNPTFYTSFTVVVHKRITNVSFGINFVSSLNQISSMYVWCLSIPKLGETKTILYTEINISLYLAWWDDEITNTLFIIKYFLYDLNLLCAYLSLSWLPFIVKPTSPHNQQQVQFPQSLFHHGPHQQQQQLYLGYRM